MGKARLYRYCLSVSKGTRRFLSTNGLAFQSLRGRRRLEVRTTHREAKGNNQEKRKRRELNGLAFFLLAVGGQTRKTKKETARREEKKWRPHSGIF